MGKIEVSGDAAGKGMRTDRAITESRGSIQIRIIGRLDEDAIERRNISQQALP
jgi:hypothetical protein